VNVLILVTRSQRAFVWAAAAAGVIAALVAPSMWARDFSGRMPLSLALFLNPHGASLFPLFPWISFVLAGSCAAHLFLNAVDKKKDARHMRRAFIGGLIAIAGSMAAREWTLFSAWNTDFYRTSPLYVLIRLGCVLMVGAALYYLESRWKWAPHTIRLAGQESLLVYTLHLMLIFSILRGTVTASVLGKEAGYPVCFLMSAVIIVLMLWLAGVWHKLKKDHARFAKRGLIALVALNALIFLLR
jgi:fucose 4-O-acetylase-like acetyltransferase